MSLAVARVHCIH